jgi:hypothetical protein
MSYSEILKKYFFRCFLSWVAWVILVFVFVVLSERTVVGPGDLGLTPIALTMLAYTLYPAFILFEGTGRFHATHVGIAIDGWMGWAMVVFFYVVACFLIAAFFAMFRIWATRNYE